MKYILFGAGEFAKKVLENINKEDVLCFNDNNKNKTGKTLDGKPILSLEEFRQRKDFKN